MKKLLIILLLIVGCAPNPYDLTVESYQEQSPRINLGMTKYEVSQILSPTQELLPTISIKERGMYMRDSIFIEIIYYRPVPKEYIFYIVKYIFCVSAIKTNHDV